MSVTINSLELANIKRIKAVKLEPTSSGLTIIGGKNGQGKTSVLDAIAWALGGNKFKPSAAERDGAYTPPSLKVTLSNGLVVERSGKSSNLKVTDPQGRKAGQQLLDCFISVFALDLPKFMNASDKDKAEILLQIIGVGEELGRLESAEAQVYSQRTAIGKIADQKKKYADELKGWEGVPEMPVSASELIAKHQAILLKNAENQKKRDNLHEIEAKYAQLKNELQRITLEIQQTEKDLTIAHSETYDLQDESTAELEANISAVDTLNAKIRDNMSKAQAADEADHYAEEYEKLSKQLNDIRKSKTALLENADLPLPELSVTDGKLTYKNKQWDSMSGSEQLRVATAIVRKLNPECGFVLLDKLEQMDLDTLKDFGEWLSDEGLQAIATRVSTGDECSIIIEDGYVSGESAAPAAPRKWTSGSF
ncbi:MAG: AAA family ATPase [Ruminococcus sp.]